MGCQFQIEVEDFQARAAFESDRTSMANERVGANVLPCSRASSAHRSDRACASARPTRSVTGGENTGFRRDEASTDQSCSVSRSSLRPFLSTKLPLQRKSRTVQFTSFVRDQTRRGTITQMGRRRRRPQLHEMQHRLRLDCAKGRFSSLPISSFSFVYPPASLPALSEDILLLLLEQLGDQSENQVRLAAAFEFRRIAFRFQFAPVPRV